MKASRKLLKYLKPYWVFALLGPLAMVAEVALDLMQPHLVQLIIDRGLRHHNQAYVLHTLYWMLVLTAGGLVMGAICAIFATQAAQNFGADLRAAAFRRVQSFSFGNYDEMDSGSLITRIANDVKQVQDLVMTMLRFMVRAPLLMLGSLIMGVWTCPRLSYLFLILVPAVVVILIVIVSRTFPLFKKVQQSTDTVNTVTQENLSGVRVVKAFGRKEYERNRFGDVNRELMERNIWAVRLGSLTNPLMMLVLNGGIIAAVYIGGYRVKTGDLQVGEVVAFINYLYQSLMALMRISVQVIQLSRSEASAQRVVELLESEPTLSAAPLADDTENEHLGLIQGEIEFQNVTFSYNLDAPEPVLKNISFVVPAGKTTAILGATGSGKSTIALLAARFYDPTSGRVLIDGVDARRIPEKRLRGSIGYALQVSVLFSGTIRENIAYAKPDAEDDEVFEAARIANAAEFIGRLPDGYSSLIGQRGVNLSGGQKQRVAIARAILPRPAILILDDSTSAVDVRTEALIHGAIGSQDLVQTRLIVAQRISTVQNADNIILLENGEIVGEGPHEELLMTSGLYREIFDSQQQNRALESNMA